MMNKIAQIQIAPDGGFKGFGPLGLDGDLDGNMASYIFQNFISSVVGLITIIALIWFVFIITTGGIAYMNAGADQKAAESSRKKITSGLIGLLITIFGLFLIRLVGEILSLPDILNINKMLESIKTN